MSRSIPHMAHTTAETDITDVVIPTPQPSDVAPSLDHMNAVTGPIIAGLVNQVAVANAYIGALLASHTAKDNQIAALKKRLAPVVNGTED